MKYVVAVSGGVDSVVLLDLMARAERFNLVVAHFDHGIRDQSAHDARFVEELACQYALPFESARENLGADASEELARQKRYEFLHNIAQKHDSQLVSAHHHDDAVETAALNLTRGTRWRGLAAMSDQRILRPLSDWTKQQIYDYALKNRLEWCEDATNLDKKYRRNELRAQIYQKLSLNQRQKLHRLWKNQLNLRRNIEKLTVKYDEKLTDRHFLTMIDASTALELLFSYILRKHRISLLSHQLQRLLVIIKTARPGTRWQIGQGLIVWTERRDWGADVLKR